MTFIDPVIGWFVITQVPSTDQSFVRISQLFNQAWVSRYPRPQRVRFDNGSEVKKNCIPLLKDFCIKAVPTYVRKT